MQKVLVIGNIAFVIGFLHNQVKIRGSWHQFNIIAQRSNAKLLLVDVNIMDVIFYRSICTLDLCITQIMNIDLWTEIVSYGYELKET